eukprot:NODE_73_length_24441_cov_0.672952.p2 type:complete len:676 gc:universal NODE_73_length_24441_cov_0.672952:21175-19148(-)
MIATVGQSVQLSAFITKHGVHVTDLRNEIILEVDANCVALGIHNSHVYLFVLRDNLILYKWHESMVFIEKAEPLAIALEAQDIQVVNDRLVYKDINCEVLSVPLDDLDGMAHHMASLSGKFLCLKKENLIEYEKNTLTFHFDGVVTKKTIPFTITTIVVEGNICVVGTKGGQILIFRLDKSLQHFEMYHWHSSAVTGIAVLDQTICSIGHESVLVYYHMGTKSKDFISRIHRGPIQNMVKCGSSLLIKAEDNAIYSIMNNSNPVRLFKKLILESKDYKAKLLKFEDFLYVNSTAGIIQVVNQFGDVVDTIDYAPEWRYTPKCTKKMTPIEPILTDFLICQKLLICVVNELYLRVYHLVDGEYTFKLLQKASSQIMNMKLVDNSIFIAKSKQVEVYDLTFTLQNVHKLEIEYNASAFSKDGTSMIICCDKSVVIYSFKYGILKELRIPGCRQIEVVKNTAYCVSKSALYVIDILTGCMVSAAKFEDGKLFESYIFGKSKNLKLNIHDVLESKRRHFQSDKPLFKSENFPTGTNAFYDFPSSRIIYSQAGILVSKKSEGEIATGPGSVTSSARHNLMSIYNKIQKDQFSLPEVHKTTSFIEPLQELFDLPNNHMYVMDDDLCALLESQMQFEEAPVLTSDSEYTIPRRNSFDLDAGLFQFHSSEFRKPPKYLKKLIK